MTVAYTRSSNIADVTRRNRLMMPRTPLLQPQLQMGLPSCRPSFWFHLRGFARLWRQSHTARTKKTRIFGPADSIDFPRPNGLERLVRLKFGFVSIPSGRYDLLFLRTLLWHRIFAFFSHFPPAVNAWKAKPLPFGVQVKVRHLSVD
jgi:hypothetical protein